MKPAAFLLALALMLALAAPSGVLAQQVWIQDLTVTGGEGPVRLVGYGLVVGLSNSGDRAIGGRDGGMTVRSVANLLRNLGVEVPEQAIRTRNAAAVLVTAEASPYTRRGGRFDVTVASVGDATSLRGGMLWTTPLFTAVGGSPAASAQGSLVFPAGDGRRGVAVETSGLLSQGGVAIADLGQSAMELEPDILLLKQPDLGTAQRIAEAVNLALGEGTAVVEDPGAVRIVLLGDDPMGTRARIAELSVSPSQTARVVIDARSGAVAAGGRITVGPALVSHEWLTLTIFEAGEGGEGDFAGVPGSVRAESGVQVQALAEALHAVGATADVISSIFQSLRQVGALRAEVVVR